MLQNQQLQSLTDKLDTLFTVAALTLEADNHEPGRKELQFFVDSGVQILDEIMQAIGPEEEEINGEITG